MAKTTTKVMVRIHDIESGEVIDREATAEELAQMQLDADASINRTVEKQAQEDTRQAILDRLGITAEEAALLLG
jgi:hypothetical protein